MRRKELAPGARTRCSRWRGPIARGWWAETTRVFVHNGRLPEWCDLRGLRRDERSARSPRAPSRRAVRRLFTRTRTLDRSRRAACGAARIARMGRHACGFRLESLGGLAGVAMGAQVAGTVWASSSHVRAERSSTARSRRCGHEARFRAVTTAYLSIQKSRPRRIVDARGVIPVRRVLFKSSRVQTLESGRPHRRHTWGGARRHLHAEKLAITLSPSGATSRRWRCSRPSAIAVARSASRPRRRHDDERPVEFAWTSGDHSTRRPRHVDGWR